MKKISRPSRSSGFTLVELLVVIAIIAILASVVLAGVSTAINAAKRVKASNTATQIQTAVINYYTEYGVYPVPSSAGGTPQDAYYPATGDQNDWENLMWALCGNLNASTAQPEISSVSNTRAIPFLTPRRSDVDGNGVPVNPFSSTTAANPIYFNIVIDADYDGIAGDSNGGANMPDFTPTNWPTGQTASVFLTHGVAQGVAVWACCDPAFITNPTGSKSPNFWVHTY
jgi:prepilin-type N-terminal cleavage/methylation domain-containing protein